MTTRPYSECLAQVAALAGCDFAAQETARVKIFLNRRAKRAYAECEMWPRFYVVGEERICSEEGLIPYEEDDKETIGTVLRIDPIKPFVDRGSFSYYDFYADAGGIQIAGYCPQEYEGNFGMIISGALNPNAGGTIPYGGDYPFGGADGITRPYYSTDGEYDAPAVGTWTMIYYDGFSGYWVISHWADNVNTGVWESATTAALTPDAATEWAPLVGTGTPAVTAEEFYSAYVTYKAAMPETYGDADGDEPEVPEEWFEYMAQGAYADFLRSDGSTDKALVEDTTATELLEQQLMKVSRQGGSAAATRIVTHGNTQCR